MNPAEATGLAPLVGIPIVIALLFFSAFFSGSEAALFSLQPIERENMEHKGRTGRLVARLLSSHRRTLASVLMGNELANISLATVCASLTLTLLPQYPWANILIATPLLVLFGEITPKAISLRYNSVISRFVAMPLTAWAKLVAPIRWLITLISNSILYLLRVDGGNLISAIGEQQLRRLIDESHEAGTIGEVEQELIHRVFEFSDIPISRLMTPRPDLVSIPLSMPYAKVIELIRTEKRSRIPVYKGRPDNIVGVLLTKDLLRFTGGAPPTPRYLKRLLQTPYFVPTTKKADDLLEEFQRYRTHLALVVDEHGSLAGLVTLDDLLEELVGEVLDEDQDSMEVERIQSNIWTISGSMDLQDFAEETGLEVPAGDYHTLAGFVFTAMGHLPDKGESIQHAGTTYVVSGIEQHRITEITVYMNHEGEE
ncbi:MAG: hemolysin family protein [Myxococcota bacterium]|nr:hemolysin family protein [Myxococcota bacterium]